MSTLLCPSSIDSVDDLRALQRLMGGALFMPLINDDEDLATTWTDGRSMDSMVGEFLKPNEHLTASDRLAIYSRSYWFRLFDCLYDDFPTVRSLLGEKKFHAMARAYLAARPSQSWTLRNLGSRLVTFIEKEPQWTAPRTAMAKDIALFEWAQVLAFDEARKEPLHGDQLLGSDPNALRLGLQPYCSFIETQYAVDDYFSSVRERENISKGTTSNTTGQATKRPPVKRVPLPKKQRIWLAVHRCDTDIYFKRITREAFLLFQSLSEGQTVTAALESALADADPSQDWAAQIQDLFQNAASLGWFCEPTP